MIATCEYCGKSYKTLPSWYKRSKRHFCGKPCFMAATVDERSKHISEVGKPFRYKPGNKPAPNRNMPSGKNHYAWKGDGVSYRGLHYWLRRVKGVPTTCVKCGSTTSVQWANIDGKYRRNPDDYEALCASCHKIKDLAMTSTHRVPPAT